MTGNCLGWVAYAAATQDLFVLFSNAPGLILSIWLNMGAAKLQYQQMHQLVNLHHDHPARADDDGALDADLHHSLHLQVDTNDDNDDDYDDEVIVQYDEESRNYARISGTSNRNGGGGRSTRTMNHDSFSSSFSSLLPSFTPHEIWVLRVVLVWLIILCIVCFIPMTSEQQANIIGSVVNMNLVIFYGAPLSTIVQVIKTRNSCSIHRRTMGE
jgi:solute carrier family 50 protein (sugar transporter)